MTPLPSLIAITGFLALFNRYTLRWFPLEGGLALIFSPQTYFILVSLIIAKHQKLTASQLGLTRNFLKRNIGIGLCVGLIPALLTIFGALLLNWIDQKMNLFSQPLIGGTPVYFQLPAVRLLNLFVLAPISEELFFRGIFLMSLRSQYSARAATIWSALIFMAAHGTFVPGPLMLGLITAPLRLMTGSILPGIILHSISNGYGPALAKFFPNLYRYLSFLFV